MLVTEFHRRFTTHVIKLVDTIFTHRRLTPWQLRKVGGRVITGLEKRFTYRCLDLDTVANSLEWDI